MQYSKNRFWRKHKSQIIFGTAIAGSLLFSYKDIAQNMQMLSQNRQELAANNNRQMMLEERLAFEKAQAAIAEQRYQSGCTIVVAANSPRYLATLVEGEPVFDRTTQKPLPEGTIVCDINGMSGVIVKNLQGQLVVGQMAFTGNRELAQAIVKRIHGAKVYYNTPGK